MRLCVIGAGYVGLVAGTCFAEMGNAVICVDKNTDKLEKLKKGIIPIYEPGLDDLIKTNVKENRLFFTDNLGYAVKESDICFIAVGTPSDESGQADISAVIETTEKIACFMNDYKIIVNKSTVPVGTCEKLADIIASKSSYDFDIVMNPEFLKQGAAVEDFLKPDRVIIGTDSEKAFNILKELYSPFVRTGNPIVKMDTKSAEMTKYASNAFLAAKISFANEIANICEKVGADVNLVRQGMCLDQRIGSKFLFPGLGYGGSCFPKDVKALINISEQNNYNARLLEAVNDVNYRQRELFIEKITNKFSNDLTDKTFAVWGLSFKPKTNDMREAPSISVINNLISKNAKLNVFDPKALDTAKIIFGDKINYYTSAYDTLKNADALLLLTEWNEFRNPDFDKIKKSLKHPVIFDGRNQYNPKILRELGFEYYFIGSKSRPRKITL